MKHEVVFTPGRSEPETFNRCDYCNTKEHVNTMGIVSVDPKYEDYWFCSYNCLHTKKYSKHTKHTKQAKHGVKKQEKKKT